MAPGVRLIVTAAVHGNETCGTVALRRIIDEMSRGALRLAAGEVTFVPVTNPLAYERGQREGDRNLNRRLLPTAEPREFEDHVANWLCPLLARHDVLLDLHSFRSPGVAFALVGPPDNAGALEAFTHAEQESALAVRLGVGRLVDGWLSTYASGIERRRARNALRGASGPVVHADHGVGTTEYMRRMGGWALTLECGQHEDRYAPELAYQAVRRTLAHLGLVAAAEPPAAGAVESLRLFEVVDKEHADDRFSRSWTSFDPVRAGELIATRHDGTPLRAECDGFVVFPSQDAGAGQEWFYLARSTDRFAKGSAAPAAGQTGSPPLVRT
ncbi:MAG TPA: succinylglutamate desuccinylase/aspartoacylase family protein [Burkholderiaceae bacterium]